jgi:FkbM family methyltransferase
MAKISKLTRQVRKLMKVLAHRDYRRAFRRERVAAAIEHEPLLKSLAVATVVDIGANRGQFALVSRRCYPQARIISFEPLAEPAKKFRGALGNDPRVTLHEVAVGPAAGAATMHVAAEDDSSSLLPITKLQQSISGTTEVSTRTIQIEPLLSRVTSDELTAPALLKIDVQGYELSALEGCAPLLGKFAYVYVECSFVELYTSQALAGDVIAYLAGHGFTLAGIYNVQYDHRGRAVQADILFIARGR